jgi:hypothetical protein
MVVKIMKGKETALKEKKQIKNVINDNRQMKSR